MMLWGNINAAFIFPAASRQMVEQEVFAHMPGVDSVSRNPYLYDIREELKSWDDVPRNIPGGEIYCAEFDLDGGLIQLLVTREHIGVVHVCRGDCEYADEDVVSLISSLCRQSEIAVIGYEIEIYVEDVEQEIYALVSDKSWRPLFVKKEGCATDQQVCGFSIFRNGEEPSVPEKNILRYLKNVCCCGSDMPE